MSLRQVIRRRRARLDIEAAIDHYLTISDAVALQFIEAVDETTRLIVDYPQGGSPRYADDDRLKDIRFWTVGRFPYLLFYFDRGDAIDVWRVLHGSRDLPRDLDEPT